MDRSMIDRIDWAIMVMRGVAERLEAFATAAERMGMKGTAEELRNIAHPLYTAMDVIKPYSSQ